MSRRWGLLFGLVAVAGCHGKNSEPTSSARYQAVKAAVEPSSRWCDTSFTSQAPRLSLPPLAPPPAGRTQPAVSKGRRTWVNLWATWCQPCLREIPLLLTWQSELHKDGVDVDVILLSIDEDAATLDKFLAGRKDLQSAHVARASSQNDYQHWVTSFVKDASTPIPIHLLSSADGDVRCVRNGSLHEGDYPAAKAVLH
jgi:thiol-disulfide isomerase/thioredoxin